MTHNLSIMHAPKESAPTLLHGLPIAALENVLRHLSSKPVRRNWVAFVHPNDSLMAMHPSNALCDVVRDSFTGKSFRNGGSECPAFAGRRRTRLPDQMVTVGLSVTDEIVVWRF